ncbi:MAG: calcium/sodium antiporter, partial [Bacteroidota bacterium]
MSIVYIILGLTLLVVGGEFLVRASISLSFRFNLSRMVIGLTVVSFATSLPELLVSVQAALDGFSSISLGNVIGSNIANIGLVLGVTAVLAPLAIDREFYKLNWPVMMVLSVVLYFILKTGSQIDRLEGIGLIAVLCIYLWLLISRARKQAASNIDTEVEVDDQLATVSGVKIVLWLLIGGTALWGGSVLLVDGAVDLATLLGVSERVIAVTMIAIGTSVPELAASIIAALKKEKALSLGNLIGSNIFNIASVLGITAVIQPIDMTEPQVLSSDIFWMLGFAAVLIPLAFIPRRFVIGRYKGVVILIGYAVFVSVAFG